MRIDLSPHSYLEHHSAWLDAESAATLYRDLQSLLTFEQHSIQLFGKLVAQPRLITWCGTLPYTYSGLTLPPRDIPAPLVDIVTRVSEVAKTPFNHLLLNLYRSGLDSMGYHADNEAELGRHPVVATLSLGATRRFVVKARRGKPTLPLDLANGDLIVMGGRCQSEFVHGIPKQPRVADARLSVTFRLVLPWDELKT